MKHTWSHTNLQRGDSAQCLRCGLTKRVLWNRTTRYFMGVAIGDPGADKAPECYQRYALAYKHTPTGEGVQEVRFNDLDFMAQAYFASAIQKVEAVRLSSPVADNELWWRIIKRTNPKLRVDWAVRFFDIVEGELALADWMQLYMVGGTLDDLGAPQFYVTEWEVKPGEWRKMYYKKVWPRVGAWEAVHFLSPTSRDPEPAPNLSLLRITRLAPAVEVFYDRLPDQRVHLITREEYMRAVDLCLTQEQVSVLVDQM